jgi:hypothetical protein
MPALPAHVYAYEYIYATRVVVVAAVSQAVGVMLTASMR